MSELDIVFPCHLWKQLQEHLLQVSESSDGVQNEQLAFILAGSNKSSSSERLLIREILCAEPHDLVKQTPTYIEPCSEFVVPLFHRCKAEGWNLIEVHSHPFSKDKGTTFSETDWCSDKDKFPSYAALIENFIHATMVVGQESFDAHYYDRKSRSIQSVNQIIIVGVDGEKTRQGVLTYLNPTSAKRIDQEYTNTAIYERQEMFIGKKSQEKLAQANVALVGVGGLGSMAVMQLAHLGLGNLILVDPDKVEETNLNRLIGATKDDIGEAKVDVYERLVNKFSQSIHVQAIPSSIMEKEAIDAVKSADIILGCVDNHGARFLLNQIAVRNLIPYIDAGSGISIDGDQNIMAGGQVQVVMPGVGCLECRGFIDPKKVTFDLASQQEQAEAKAHGYGLQDIAPAIIYLNGVVASIQVEETVLLLTNQSIKDIPPISIYDLIEGTVRPIQTIASQNCATCGTHGLFSYGDLAPLGDRK